MPFISKNSMLNIQFLKRDSMNFIEQKRTRTRLITFNGKTQSIKEWEQEMDFPRQTLDNRLNKLGWSIERALTTPVKVLKRTED